MAAHPYSLRSRLNGQSPSLRTPTGSPAPRSGTRSPRKGNASGVSLQLQHVIGTTTNSPTGLACCTLTNTYAYCAGAIAVLATVHPNGATTKRYFKARPTAASLNPSSSFYATSSSSATQPRRRPSIFTRRQPTDINFGTPQDNGSSQTWTARERIKTVTCVALSDSGKWMAVGESGYNPRVLLFSTTEEVLHDIPVSIVSDHTFGLSCVAFSSDSRYLATLGNLNDGFLFIWAVNPKTGSLALHATNKCTTSICSMTFCGQSLITVGTRHVKIWSVAQSTASTPSRRFSLRPTSETVPSAGPAILCGRNALLGSLGDCTFTSTVAIDGRLVFVGTDTGQLCGVEVSDGSLELKILKVFDFGITSLSWHPQYQRVVVGGQSGILHEDYSTLIARMHASGAVNSSGPRSPRKETRSSSIRQSLGLLRSPAVAVSALACLPQHIIALDNNGNLHLNKVGDSNVELASPLAYHNDLVQGVQKFPNNCSLGAFYTWSRRGEVRCWDIDGNLLHSKLVLVDQEHLEDDMNQNELRVVRYMPHTKQFVTGDRLGILRLVESQDWNSSWTGRAHGAELTDIAIHESPSFVVTCGRDRMVQLFNVVREGLDLIQTMDDHIGAVTQVYFTPDAGRLLSCSADRTVVVRERASRQVEGADFIAYLSVRIITLRSTPLSMAFAESTSTTLLVSTNDRHVVKIDTLTGTIVESSKVIDPENDDTVSLNSICVSARGSGPEETCSLLAAFSSTDKSIRVYDSDNCQLLARESGHTEGVSALCLIESQMPGLDRRQRVLVSTGLDGTIILWRINLGSPALFTTIQESQTQAMHGCESYGTPMKPSPASLPPLRKVLSKMDAIEFVKSSGIASPRSLSPPRLARKRSNLALSATIDETEENGQRHSDDNRSGDQDLALLEHRRSPPVPPLPFLPLETVKKLRPRAEPMAGGNATSVRCSPSPPPYSISTPTTPRQRTVANNSKLRRPPSVPTDLRGQSLAQSRSKSMSQTNEFGSMGMATEQACRMLRTYRKKLMASKEDLSLDELQGELELVTKLVSERKDRPPGTRTPNGRRLKAKGAMGNDLDELAILLERTNMVDRSPQQGVEVKGGFDGF